MSDLIAKLNELSKHRIAENKLFEQYLASGAERQLLLDLYEQLGPHLSVEGKHLLVDLRVRKHNLNNQQFLDLQASYERHEVLLSETYPDVHPFTKSAHAATPAEPASPPTA